jgi:hypothetical protein
MAQNLQTAWVEIDVVDLASTLSRSDSWNLVPPATTISWSLLMNLFAHRNIRHTWSVLGMVVAASLCLASSPASASVVTYSASDDGAPTTGPFTNSDAAATSFLSAASSLAPTSTITFEDQPDGYNAIFTAAPGVTVALTGPIFGSGFSGISNTTLGNLYGFNITPGGSNWLGFPYGSATFSFASPTHAFGFYLTGVQTNLTSNIGVLFSDGTNQSLSAPINVDGGAAFFGFTDAGKSISSIVISNAGNDAWGIDNVSFNSTSNAVPEPSEFGLFGFGLLAMGFLLRRRARGQQQ